jgi:hypothetical protein
MISVSLRPIGTLGIGIVLGLLIALGVFGRSSIGSTNAPVSTSVTPSQSELPVAALATASPNEGVLTNLASPSSSALPASSPLPQSNGLPLGVTQNALNYNKELYNKYPGLQPPLINTDGRNLGPEATKGIEGPRTMLPYVGPSLNASPITGFPWSTGGAGPSPLPSAQ